MGMVALAAIIGMMNATPPTIKELMDPPPRRAGQRRRRFLWLGGLCVVAVVLVGGLELASYAPATPHTINLVPDAEQSRRAVLAEVPRGCNVWLARDIMEMNGFKCRMRYDQSFYLTRFNGSQIEELTHSTYLECVKTEPYVVGIEDLRWQVAIVINKKGVVRTVYVNVIVLSKVADQVDVTHPENAAPLLPRGK